MISTMKPMAITANALSRRTVLFSLGWAAVPVLLLTYARAEQQAAHVEVYRAQDCSCCGAWADHLRQAGFDVTVHDDVSVNGMKAKYGVPPKLRSCHTAIIENYVLEGHVPAGAVKRLLAERPQAKGLAVPGMPVGSPGMESGDEKDEYDVILFGGPADRVFARYRGGELISL
jgi:hypothetical protein